MEPACAALDREVPPSHSRRPRRACLAESPPTATSSGSARQALPRNLVKVVFGYFDLLQELREKHPGSDETPPPPEVDPNAPAVNSRSGVASDTAGELRSSASRARPRTRISPRFAAACSVTHPGIPGFAAACSATHPHHPEVRRSVVGRTPT